MSFMIMLLVFVSWFAVGSFLLRRIKVKNSCGATFLLIIIASIGTILTQRAIDWYEQWQIVQQDRAAEEHAIEIQQAVRSFLAKMNPQLHRKFLAIGEEVARIDNSIQQLMALKKDFPNHPLIDNKLNQWLSLKEQLQQVSEDIDQQVEQAYIAYRMDEIQGVKFSLLSEELLKEANAVLANAETTRMTIEEQVSE